MSLLTAKEARLAGEARRKKLSRHDLGEFSPKRRRVEALALLERSMHGRMPSLIPYKYELMAGSPFAYFRGAAPVMAADLAASRNTSLLCQICGDAHVRNLGAYAAPDGRLLFDINDFDETVRAPFEWDLKRMTSSLMLAGRAAGHKDSSAQSAVTACAKAYAGLMEKLAQMPFVEASRFQVHRMEIAKPIHAAFLKAERATPQHIVEQLTQPSSRKKNSPRQFKESKPTLVRETGKSSQQVIAALKPYRAMLEVQRQYLLSLYQPVDVAFKIVGTGSVGLRDYCIYFEGNGPGDPLFLQIKEQVDSAYAPYLRHARRPGHNGQRVVEGQRAMQMQSDPLLGWTSIGKRQFLVRQLNDHKGSIEIEDLAGPNLGAYAEVCGELLARGHCRSGDARVIAGYVGSGTAFAEGLVQFATAYADQTEKDWEALRRSGKVKLPL